MRVRCKKTNRVLYRILHTPYTHHTKYIHSTPYTRKLEVDPSWRAKATGEKHPVDQGEVHSSAGNTKNHNHGYPCGFMQASVFLGTYFRNWIRDYWSLAWTRPLLQGRCCSDRTFWLIMQLIYLSIPQGWFRPSGPIPGRRSPVQIEMQIPVIWISLFSVLVYWICISLSVSLSFPLSSFLFPFSFFLPLMATRLSASIVFFFVSI